MDIELRNRYLFSQKLVKEVGEIALDFYLNRNELKIECKKGDLQDQVSIADKTVEATFLKMVFWERNLVLKI